MYSLVYCYLYGQNFAHISQSKCYSIFIALPLKSSDECATVHWYYQVAHIQIEAALLYAKRQSFVDWLGVAV